MKREFIVAACLITLTCSLAHAGRVGVLTGLGGPETFNSATPTFSGATPGVGVLGLFRVTTNTVPSPDPGNPVGALPQGSNASTFRVETEVHTAGFAENTFEWTVNNVVMINQVTFTLRPSPGLPFPGPTHSHLPGAVLHDPGILAGWTGQLTGVETIRFRRNIGFAPAGTNETFDFRIAIWSYPNPAYFDVSMEASNPEPGSIALGGFAVALFGCVALRRRRKRKLAELENTAATS